MKPELLAPAGDLATLKVAIQAGADAVYIGGRSFGARYFATNFSNEDLEEAVIYAHQRNKKVYITVNTIVYQSELNELIEYIDYLYKINVDAIIVQDLGVISLVRTKYPDFEIHASTQMNVFNKYAIDVLKKLGVKRVVLARETPIHVIKELTKSGIEIEVFVHGALCFSCSGNCLMSYSIGDRSGNRGKCAQPCRKTYSLYENDNLLISKKALLSMKDLCTIDNIQELIKANVKSFKIEGRMKSSEYVYTVVKSYKKAIEKNYLDYENDIKNMKIMFNRYFTGGYIFNESNKNITNIESVNHQGIYLGKIVKQNSSSIEVKLNETLHRLDAIRIKTKEDIGFVVQNMFVGGEKRDVANPGEIVKISFISTNKVLGKDVLLTKSDFIKQEMNLFLQKENVKNPLKAIFNLKLNEKASLVIYDNDKKYEVLSNEIISNEINNPKEDEFYIEKLSKLNDTPFYFSDVKIYDDKKSYISVKELNEMRRNAIDLILKDKITDFSKSKEHFAIDNKSFEKMPVTFEAIVNTKDQYDACIELGIKNIYTDYKSELMNISRLDDNKYDNHMVHNLGQINNESVISPYLNIINSESLNLYKNLGSKKIYLSYETNIDELKSMNIKEINTNIGFPVYGRMDVMLTKHCMISKTKGFSNKNCKSCINNDYYLLDEYNNKFPILTEVSNDCNIRIIDYKVFDYTSKIERLKECGINLFLLTFTVESKEEVKKILAKIIQEDLL